MIDASVAVKPVLFDEPLVASAIAVITLAGRRPSRRWAMPDLFDVECANVVAKAVRHGRLGLDQAESALRLLCTTPGRRVTSDLLVEAALTLALSLSLSVYDACYAALAVLLDVPLVTADARLVAALEGGPVEAVYLGDIVM